MEEDDSVLPLRQVVKDPYLCIEFPGYVKNQENALKTLRGENALVAAHGTQQAQIPLYFRPNDPYAHPIFLDRILTNNFVLEVTKTTENATGHTEVSAEIIGAIPHTYSFKGMADYQYLPPDFTERVLDPRSNVAPMDEDDVAVQHFPPPIFSKSDQPHLYNFESNPNFRLEVTKAGTADEQKRYVPRRVKQFSDAQLPVIQYEIDTVPSEPPTTIDGPVSQDFVAAFEDLFKAHPVWTRQALLSRMQDYEWHQLFASLYMVAYSFSNGPWRHLFIKLGVDPRKEASFRRYQVIDFRIKPFETRGKIPGGWQREPTDKPSRRGGNQLNISRAKAEHRELFMKQRSDELKFLKPPSQQHTLFCLNEMELDGLEPLLKRPPSITCTRDYGWFTPPLFRQIRALMKDTLPRLIREWDSGDLPMRLAAAVADLEQDEEVEEAPEEDEMDADDSWGYGRAPTASEYLEEIGRAAGSGGHLPDDLVDETFQILGEDDD